MTDTTAPYIVLPQECMTIDNLAHELGHFFGLTNTYGPTAETISLEVTNGDNCLTEGDKI